MSSIKHSLLTFYTPAEMYALVADVERYPKFLPACRTTRILSRCGDEVRATVELAYKGIRKSFTTRNRMTPNQGIDMHLEEGPFCRLEGGWRFEPLGNGCKVILEIEFEFASKPLALAIGPIFKAFVNTLADAFLKQAQRVYGKR